MSNVISVVVFRDLCSIGGVGIGLVCHGYICILLYVKLIWCSGFPDIYAQLDERFGSLCYGYMCILLYVKLPSCSGFLEIYARLKDKGGVTLPWLYVHSSKCETSFM